MRHFDPAPQIWLSSLGISAIVGIALLLSVESKIDTRPNHWQTFRLFLMPFCVSSFSALIKGHGYFLILPPQPVELATSLVLCAAFVLIVYGLKITRQGAGA